MAENETQPDAIAVPQVKAARMLGVTDRTIRNWDKAGIIKGTKVDGVKLYQVAELKKLVGAA